MTTVKKLCVCGVAAMALGVPLEASAQCGTASWYHEGARTANGERYRPDGISAAHRSLPFGTIVQVRNQRTGRTVTVRINDRGPFIRGRIIDLSRGAKRIIGMDGLAPVCLAVLGRGPRVASANMDEGRTARRGRLRMASKASRTRVASLRQKQRVAKLSRRDRSVTLNRTTLASGRVDGRIVAKPRRKDRAAVRELRARSARQG